MPSNRKLTLNRISVCCHRNRRPSASEDIIVFLDHCAWFHSVRLGPRRRLPHHDTQELSLLLGCGPHVVRLGRLHESCLIIACNCAIAHARKSRAHDHIYVLRIARFQLCTIPLPVVRFCSSHVAAVCMGNAQPRSIWPSVSAVIS